MVRIAVFAPLLLLGCSEGLVIAPDVGPTTADAATAADDSGTPGLDAALDAGERADGAALEIDAAQDAGDRADAAAGPDAATRDAGAPDSGPASGGAPLYGTLHSPNNRPISEWEADIRAHYGLSSTASIVDPEATADWRAAFTDGTGNFGTPYVVFRANSYALYWAQDGDPEYPIADSGGATRTCPLDVGTGWTGIRVPAGAKVWANGMVAIDPMAGLVDDFHLTIVDPARNRVYAFYGGSGSSLGLSGGKLRTPYRGCDLLHGDDAAILAQQAAAKRYGCAGGAGYPPAGCGLEGIGAGVSAGNGFGNGDSNGFLGPHGVIVPEDFDDTGWSGAAVGTLHHALRCSNPGAYQHGYMWPMQNPAAGTAGRALRDGQIIRLDPAFDVEASSASAADKRLLRTLQRYGCVLSDYANYGMALFAQSAWAGTGPRRGADPWTAAGGANAEAQAFASGMNANGIRFGLPVPTAMLEVVRPHGAAYPAR